MIARFARNAAITMALTLASSLAPEQAHSAEHPCASDMAKFCADKKLGHGRTQCLLDHAEELTPACRERVSRGRSKPGDAPKDADQEN